MGILECYFLYSKILNIKVQEVDHFAYNSNTSQKVQTKNESNIYVIRVL